jgi:hypothetical protein
VASLRRKFVIGTIGCVGAIAAVAFGLRWCAHEFVASIGRPSANYDVVAEAPRVYFAAPILPRGIDRLVVDGSLIRKIEERCLGGFIDWHYAYRVECERAILDALIESHSMTERRSDELCRAFVEIFPELKSVLEPSAPVLVSPQFTHVGRGHDGNHYAGLYDEAKSTLYLWALHNF